MAHDTWIYMDQKLKSFESVMPLWAAANKFKFKLNSFSSPSRTHSLTSYWILVQSFYHAQSSSAIGSYSRSDSSTTITFSHLHINKLYIVLRSNDLFARHIFLVCDPCFCVIKHLNVCIGPLKGTSEWGLMHCTIIAKPISSLDRAAYARCWCCSAQSPTLQKQPSTYQYLDATLGSM